jgi:hypothetical protein
MRRLTTGALALLAATLLAPAMLRAETVTYCDSFPRQTIRDFTLTIPAFNRPGCALSNAQVTLDVAVDGAFYGENTGNCLAGGCAEYDSSHVALAFSDLNGSPVGSAHDVAQHRTLTSYDGVLDYAGTSGYTSPYVWSAYAGYSMSYSNLAQFLAAQGVFVDTSAWWYRTGPGNGSYGVRTYIRGKVCVTYTYTCPVGTASGTWASMKVLYR